MQVTMATVPIQDPQALDLVGERKESGVDLGIVCSGPLDDSAETLKLLARKIENYLTEAINTGFAVDCPSAKYGPARIFVCCDFAVSAVAQGLIHALAKKACEVGAELKLAEPVV